MSVSNFVNGNKVDGYTVITKKGKYSLCILLLVALGMFLYGTIVDTFEFQFHGLASIALNWSSQSVQSYSMLSLVASLFKITEVWNDPWGTFGVVFLQIVFFCVAFIVPIVRLVTVGILWVCPLSMKNQSRLQVFNHYLLSWNCIEVYLVSIVAALFEVGMFAAFMVGDKCDSINYGLQTIGVKSGAVPADLGVCFSVSTKFHNSMIVLFVSVVLSTIVSRIVTNVSQYVIDVRHGCNVQENEDADLTQKKTVTFTHNVCLALGFIHKVDNRERMHSIGY